MSGPAGRAVLTQSVDAGRADGTEQDWPRGPGERRAAHAVQPEGVEETVVDGPVGAAPDAGRSQQDRRGLTTAAAGRRRFSGAQTLGSRLIFLWRILQLPQHKRLLAQSTGGAELNQDAAIGRRAMGSRSNPARRAGARRGTGDQGDCTQRPPTAAPHGRINWKKIFSTAGTGLRWIGHLGHDTENDEDSGLQVAMVLVPHGAPRIEIIEGSWNHLRDPGIHNDVVFREHPHPRRANAIGLTPLAGVDPPAVTAPRTRRAQGAGCGVRSDGLVPRHPPSQTELVGEESSMNGSRRTSVLRSASLDRFSSR